MQNGLSASLHESASLPPLLLPGRSVVGAEIMRELTGPVALDLWQALRSVLLWSQAPQNTRHELFDSEGMSKWERGLLARPPNSPLRDPLALIASELRTPEASPRRLGWVCVCITDWALGRSAVATALGFAQAAASAWPQHPRYAWLVGRLLRTQGHLRDAEFWQRHAVTLAAAQRDWETQALALHALGNTRLELGNAPMAEATLYGSLRLAVRHHLREREAELSHDLFILGAMRRDIALSHHWAQRAFDLYRHLQHPRLIFFAHDLVSFWTKHGYYVRARALSRALASMVTLLPARIGSQFARPQVSFGGVAREPAGRGGLGTHA